MESKHILTLRKVCLINRLTSFLTSSFIKQKRTDTKNPLHLSKISHIYIFDRLRVPGDIFENGPWNEIKSKSILYL